MCVCVCVSVCVCVVRVCQCVCVLCVCLYSVCMCVVCFCNMPVCVCLHTYMCMCKRTVHVFYGSTLAELPYACLVQPIQDTKLSRITSYSVLSIYWHDTIHSIPLNIQAIARQIQVI